MSKIFLSYRRHDSAGVAGRIYDRLRAHFGDDAVFMDIDSIPFGVDFRERIDAAVGQCDVFLAVIGTKWTGESDAHRRLEDPRDFVRIEIESALQRDIPVIPILIDHARMPTGADLPPSLARLTYRNAIDIDQGRDFHPHVDRLVRGIEFHFQRARETGHRSKPPPPQPGQEHKNSIGMKLIRIDAGEFLMGSSNDQIDRLMQLFPDSTRERFNDEQPQHAVKISQPFLLGMHPVTQGQYEAVMGNNPSRSKVSNDLPVENVSWIDAVTFCNKLSVSEGMPACYRLPSEAEWEFACRAGSASLFPWGDGPEMLGEHGWYKENSSGQTHAVGQKKPNVWGLHDMLGNVWEWCGDWYDQTCYALSPGSDPPGPPWAPDRVIRGGGWMSNPRGARSANRSWEKPGIRNDYLGFRLAQVQSGR